MVNTVGILPIGIPLGMGHGMTGSVVLMELHTFMLFSRCFSFNALRILEINSALVVVLFHR